MASGSGLTRGTFSLTAKSIQALKPGTLPYRVCDQRCIGLAVRVAKSGTKTWDLAFRIRGLGRVRRLSLGRVDDVSLEQARARANAVTSAARAGRDLISEEEENRATAASRITVDKLIEIYVRRRVAGRLRTAREIESRLRRALSAVLPRNAVDVRRRDIREILDAVADGGIEREAEKRRQTVGAMFRWALSQDFVELDPTAGLKAYDPGTPRDRVLSMEEIRTLWQWFQSGALPSQPTDVLKLQLLTGARCGEIAGLRAEEVDQLTWTWTLPAERSKNKKARVTPLVGITRQILSPRLLATQSGPLFLAETGSVLSATHIGHYLLARREKLPIEKFTSHDLRRTQATMLVEMGVSLDLVSAVIGHEAGGAQNRTLLRHYVRSDLIERKKTVLAAWDARVQEIISGYNETNVLRLARPG